MKYILSDIMKTQGLRILNRFGIGFILCFIVCVFCVQPRTWAEKNPGLSNQDKSLSNSQEEQKSEDINENLNQEKVSEKKTLENKEVKVNKKAVTSYSFRPLLIQGKKHVMQKSKDMKVDSGNILESKLFFIDIDFKKRIFEQEGME